MVSGVTLTAVYDSFNMISFNPANGMIIGFDMGGVALPAGEGTLLTLEFEPINGEGEIAISETIFGTTGNAEMVVSEPNPAIIPTCSNTDNDAECDLADEWPNCFDDGTDPYDDCGVCGGDNSSCSDCAGVPNGSSELDACGVCDGDNGCLAITGLSAIGGLNQVMLQWDYNPNAASYNIYRDGELACSVPGTMPYYLDDGSCGD